METIGLSLGAAALALAVLGLGWAARHDGASAVSPVRIDRLAIVSAISSVLFTVLALSLRSRPVFALDAAVGRDAYHAGGSAFVAAMKAVSWIGAYNAMLVWVPLVPVGLWKTGHARSIRYFGSAVLGSVGLENLAKDAIRRTRPATAYKLTTYSFPSSHVLAATIVAGVLAAILPSGGRSVTRRFRLEWTIWAWPAVVAASRLDLGAHYATDVLGGALLGVAWVSISHALYLTWARRRLSIGADGHPDVS